MTYAWPPLAETLAWLKITAESPAAEVVGLVVDAAAGYVVEHRPSLFPVPPAEPLTEAPSDNVGLGTVLLAARLYSRAGSPTGIAAFAEFGPASILRLDPDIERLLGLGRNAAPVVG